MTARPLLLELRRAFFVFQRSKQGEKVCFNSPPVARGRAALRTARDQEKKRASGGAPLVASQSLFKPLQRTSSNFNTLQRASSKSLFKEPLQAPSKSLFKPLQASAKSVFKEPLQRASSASVFKEPLQASSMLFTLLVASKLAGITETRLATHCTPCFTFMFHV